MGPRIWSDLVVDDGERIGHERVERLMREDGSSGLITKKWKATTVRVPGVRVADALLDRNFAAQAPNRCWVADITYLRTSEGWLYLVAVQDLYSRRIALPGNGPPVLSIAGVDPGSIASQARLMLERSAVHARRDGATSHEWVKNEFGLDQWAGSLATVYHEVVPGVSPRSSRPG